MQAVRSRLSTWRSPEDMGDAVARIRARPRHFSARARGRVGLLLAGDPSPPRPAPTGGGVAAARTGPAPARVGGEATAPPPTDALRPPRSRRRPALYGATVRPPRPSCRARRGRRALGGGGGAASRADERGRGATPRRPSRRLRRRVGRARRGAAAFASIPRSAGSPRSTRARRRRGRFVETVARCGHGRRAAHGPRRRRHAGRRGRPTRPRSARARARRARARTRGRAGGVADGALARLLGAWLGTLRLSRDVADSRAWRKLFANGALVAEALSRYFPALIDARSFDAGLSSAAKANNWEQLQAFARRLSREGVAFAGGDLAELTDASADVADANEAAERVLLTCYKLLFTLRLVPPLSHWDPPQAPARRGRARRVGAGGRGAAPPRSTRSSTRARGAPPAARAADTRSRDAAAAQPHARTRPRARRRRQRAAPRARAAERARRSARGARAGAPPAEQYRPSRAAAAERGDERHGYSG